MQMEWLKSPLFLALATLVVATLVHRLVMQKRGQQAAASDVSGSSKKKKENDTCYLQEHPETEELRKKSAQWHPDGAAVTLKSGEHAVVEGFDSTTESYRVKLSNKESEEQELPASGVKVPYVKEFYVYPIKSCRGVRLEEAHITPKGILHDREWMFVDTQGKFITQRRYPRMALIEPQIDNIQDPHTSSIILTAPGMDDLRVPVLREGQGKEMQARVWSDQVNVIDQGEAAAEWINSFLENERGDRIFRFVRVKDSFVRETDPKYAPDHSTQFADGFPFLLTIESSIDKLNEALPDSIPMNRFRPNIVVSGSPAFSDEHWHCFMISNLQFRNVRPCSRCSMPCVDQDKGVANPVREPQKTLTKIRNGQVLGFVNGKKHDCYFGSNLIVYGGGGALKSGDQVKLLTLKAEVYA